MTYQVVMIDIDRVEFSNMPSRFARFVDVKIDKKQPFSWLTCLIGEIGGFQKVQSRHQMTGIFDATDNREYFVF